MPTLTAAALLAAWERGLSQNMAARALTILAQAFPQTPPGALARMSIGRRDALLLQLRATLFGAQIAGTTVCPKCNERLEFGCRTEDILTAHDTEENAAHVLQTADFEIHFRLANSLDFMALSKHTSPHIVRAKLLQRCVLGIVRNGEAQTKPQLPEAACAALVARMAALDPQAEIKLALACNVCGEKWQSLFDIAHFLWAELNAWAPRMLRDVHLLASAYGWSEAEILQLSPLRRHFYLELTRR